MVTIPTIAEIKADILADIEAADTTSPLLPVSVWNIIATAMAGAQYLLYKLGAWLYDQIFTTSMTTDSLTSRAAEFGLTRTAATAWKGTASATGTDGTTISTGKLCTINSVAYEVVSAVDISGGTVEVTLKSLSTGDDVTLNDGDSLSWSTPQTGLDSTCTVSGTTQTGEDQESLTDFRARILSRQRNKPQGGAIPDFNGWAKEVSGIAECYTFRPEPGYVNVYPLTDEDDPEDRIPSDDKLTEVAAYINDDYTYPFGRACTAVAFTEVSFDIVFSNLSPSTSSVKAAIETAVQAYLYERRPQQYSDETNPTNAISAGELTSEAIAAGATNITVTLNNSGGSDITAAGYTLEDSELAVPGTFTWE